MCRASGVSAEIVANDVPAISEEIFDLIKRDCVPGGTNQNLRTARPNLEWNKTPSARRILLADAQTSGGLLLCVSTRHRDEVLRLVGQGATIVGRIVRATKPMLRIIS
jgi:selenide,water dikinase